MGGFTWLSVVVRLCDWCKEHAPGSSAFSTFRFHRPYTVLLFSQIKLSTRLHAHAPENVRAKNGSIGIQGMLADDGSGVLSGFVIERSVFAAQTFNSREGRSRVIDVCGVNVYSACEGRGVTSLSIIVRLCR